MNRIKVVNIYGIKQNIQIKEIIFILTNKINVIVYVYTLKNKNKNYSK